MLCRFLQQLNLDKMKNVKRQKYIYEKKNKILRTIHIQYESRSVPCST